MSKPTSAAPADTSQYTDAAWLHARSFIQEQGHVPDVMILGIYADQDIQFVFPSGQDRQQYAAACQQEASASGADLAMFVTECEMAPGDGSSGVPIVMVAFRERGGPVRVEYAHVLTDGSGKRHIGPVNSLTGEQHSSEFLDGIFTGTTTH